ncbi:MAG: enoyl-CoA hydratase/isomerase family protein [Sphingomonas sp.]|nr:enoyl-CoA hydratase/isomerase family protein [Sphingomonas sp.]
MTIDVRRLWQGDLPWDGPLAFIDLNSTVDVPETLFLPPCPTIGLGNADHPIAAQLDGIVEPPVTAEGLARQVLANPRAAAVIVQLLRILPMLPMTEGLTVESLAYGLLQGSHEHQTWLASQGSSPPESRSAGRILLIHEDNRIIATLDNPDSGNAIDRHVRDQLHEALTLAVLDPDIRQVSLRATGRTFSLGAELGEFGTTTDSATAHSIRSRTLPARVAAHCAEKLEVHVRGGCVGSGLELAAFAQHFTAARDAWFHLPELSMGILPGAGGCVSLTRRIGRQRTALLILSGKRLNARQALAWGLIDALVDEPSANDCGADVV